MCVSSHSSPSIPRADASQKGHEVMSGLEIESKNRRARSNPFRPRRERAGKFARGSLVTTIIGKRKGKMKTLRGDDPRKHLRPSVIRFFLFFFFWPPRKLVGLKIGGACQCDFRDSCPCMSCRACVCLTLVLLCVMIRPF